MELCLFPRQPQPFSLAPRCPPSVKSLTSTIPCHARPLVGRVPNIRHTTPTRHRIDPCPRRQPSDVELYNLSVALLRGGMPLVTITITTMPSLALVTVTGDLADGQPPEEALPLRTHTETSYTLPLKERLSIRQTQWICRIAVCWMTHRSRAPRGERSRCARCLYELRDCVCGQLSS